MPAPRRACLTLISLFPAFVAAQHPKTCSYNPFETFAPLSLPDPVNRYRSSSGVPGPDYWQNRADYEIHATLHPEDKQLSASELITYTNQSPDALDSLWINLDQNSYREDARSLVITDRPRRQSTEGFVLQSVNVIDSSGSHSAEYVTSDTRMQVRLGTPLKPGGGQVKIRVQYRYTVPPASFGDRTSWGKSRNGDIFDIAQWYPRMAVYDDLHGWDTLPYLANEFYLEYGHFDYFVTAPSNMLIAGSGDLMNPSDVLTAEQQKRLRLARSSDATVTIRGEAEVNDPKSRPGVGGPLTWHYQMSNTRDVSFSASSAFLWDAARINLPHGAHSLAMSFYPVESAGREAWGRSTEYLKQAVEEFSSRWYPYPYPAAVNVAGPSSGMEYPGLLFDGIEDKGKVLFWITAHEIGHTWFPMIIGFNERRNAWMDEGFNTFIDVYESDSFENGVYGPKRDSEYAPGGGNPVDEILPILEDPQAPPILTRADAISEKYRHPISYFKSALGLILLREQILGPQRFDWAFRKFIRDWAYRHPAPSDFFRAMESAGGEDLSWFWRGWYMNNWLLDLAVNDVHSITEDGRRSSQVTITNCGQLVMPATILITFADGSTKRWQLPVETWLEQFTYKFDVDSAKPITSVIVDPDHVLPDSNRTNNLLKH